MKTTRQTTCQIAAAVLFALAAVMLGLQLNYSQELFFPTAFHRFLPIALIAGLFVLFAGVFFQKRVIVIIGSVVCGLVYLIRIILGSLFVFDPLIYCVAAFAYVTMIVLNARKRQRFLEGLPLIIAGAMILSYLFVFRLLAKSVEFQASPMRFIWLLGDALEPIGIIIYGVGRLKPEPVIEGRTAEKQASFKPSEQDVTRALTFYARQYKDGILTEEEFIAKEKELFGL